MTYHQMTNWKLPEIRTGDPTDLGEEPDPGQGGQTGG